MHEYIFFLYSFELNQIKLIHYYISKMWKIKLLFICCYYFVTSTAGNLCFMANCTVMCGWLFGVCGVGEELEGSFVTYLPATDIVKRDEVYNPWKRSYRMNEKAAWETIANGTEYCDKVRQIIPYNEDTPLLNVIDVHLFDFLTGEFLLYLQTSCLFICTNRNNNYNHFQ